VKAEMMFHIRSNVWRFNWWDVC